MDAKKPQALFILKPSPTALIFFGGERFICLEHRNLLKKGRNHPWAIEPGFMTELLQPMTVPNGHAQFTGLCHLSATSLWFCATI